MFEYYYSLGEDRTLNAVSDYFNTSRQSISKYARIFKWRDRVYERDTKILRDIRDQNNDDIRETMQSYRKVIKASVADYISRLKNNKVHVETVRDFVKLVELEMHISGFEAQLFDEKLEKKAYGDGDVSQDTINTIDTILSDISSADDTDDTDGDVDGSVQ